MHKDGHKDGAESIEVTVAGDGQAETSSHRRRRGIPPAWRPWVPASLAGLALLLWVVSLPFVDVSAIDGWGLLPGLPPWWGVAVLLAIAGLVAGLLAPATSPSRRRGSWPAVAWVGPLVVLVLILFATTSVVYQVPRYPWVYKHIGVTEYLLVHQFPDSTLDIYQNFPGFFYLMGFIHLILRLPVMAMALWATPISVLVNAAAVYWAVGALTRSWRLRAVTVVLFTFANWIGQTYFSPQALAFPASLVVLGAFLRMVASGQGRPVSSPMIDGLTRPAVGRWPKSWTRPLWAQRTGVVVCVVVFAGIVVSHQFTPAAVLVQIGLLTVLLRLRRPWLVVGLALIEALWVWHAYPFLSHHFFLVEDPNMQNLRPPTALHPVIPGADAMARTVPQIITGLVAVATISGVVATVVRTRQVATLVVPVTLALAPLAFVAVQPYGQEGVMRAYMFGLPWCCFLIARDLLRVDRPANDPDDSRRRRVGTTVAAAALVAVLGILAVPAALGSEMIARIWPADVAANQWFEENTPRGTELFRVVPAYPTRSTAKYAEHVRVDNPLNPSTLAGVDGFQAAAQSDTDLLELTRTFARGQSSRHDLYLAVGPTQREYLRYYGLTSAPVYARYITGLKHDPMFTLVYEREGSYVFKVN